jgi:RecB family exonuclease
MRYRQKQFTSWSFSRYGDYRRCPLAAKLKHLDKVQEPKSAALQNGADVHTGAEQYIKGVLTRMPASLNNFKSVFLALRKQYLKPSALTSLIVESMWAFTHRWEPCRWDDWDNCWLRIKVDVAINRKKDGIIDIIDWKTGKFRPNETAVEYLEQLELYAVGALTLFSDAEQVSPQLMYLDAQLSYPDPPQVYTQADLIKLQRAWEKRVKPMMLDTRFTPRPNDKCVWCWFGQSGKSKGGPGICKY